VPVCLSIPSLLGKSSVKDIAPLIAGRLAKHIPAVMNSRNSSRIGGLTSLCVCLCLLYSKLGKGVPAATKYFWKRRFVLFLCGLCHIVRFLHYTCRMEGKQKISFSRTSSYTYILQVTTSTETPESLKLFLTDPTD
jgi:hypothetical protein